MVHRNTGSTSISHKAVRLNPYLSNRLSQKNTMAIHGEHMNGFTDKSSYRVLPVIFLAGLLTGITALVAALLVRQYVRAEVGRQVKWQGKIMSAEKLDGVIYQS